MHALNQVAVGGTIQPGKGEEGGGEGREGIIKRKTRQVDILSHLRAP